MNRYLTCMCCMIYWGAANLLYAANWPAFLGPMANGISPETLINMNWKEIAPILLWKVDLSDGGFSGPSMADGKVFINDHKDKDDIVCALDLLTGAEVWHYSYTDTNTAKYGFARSTPVIDGARVYTLSRLGIIHCLDVKTGTKIWMRDLMTDFAGNRPA